MRRDGLAAAGEDVRCSGVYLAVAPARRTCVGELVMLLSGLRGALPVALATATRVLGTGSGMLEMATGSSFANTAAC